RTDRFHGAGEGTQAQAVALQLAADRTVRARLQALQALTQGVQPTLRMAAAQYGRGVAQVGKSVLMLRGPGRVQAARNVLLPALQQLQARLRALGVEAEQGTV